MKILALFAVGVAAAAPLGLSSRAPDIAAFFGAARPGAHAPPGMGLRVPAEAPPPLVHQDRFEMPWVEGDGLRLRVTYMRTMGETEGGLDSFHVRIPGRGTRTVRMPVPDTLRGVLPVYFRGDQVFYEVELQNTGSTTLLDLRVLSRQESFEASGRAGEPISFTPAFLPVDRLGPGESVTLGRSFRLALEPRSTDPIRFEQTHVNVSQVNAEGQNSLLDAPHAGIVDPPQF